MVHRPSELRRKNSYLRITKSLALRFVVAGRQVQLRVIEAESRFVKFVAGFLASTGK